MNIGHVEPIGSCTHYIHHVHLGSSDLRILIPTKDTDDLLLAMSPANAEKIDRGRLDTALPRGAPVNVVAFSW